MANVEKQKYPLFRKIFLGMVWFIIMWVGTHVLTNFYVGFRAGMHEANPEAGGRAGVAAAQANSDRYGPVFLGISFALTMAGLRNGMFLSRKLRGDQKKS